LDRRRACGSFDFLPSDPDCDAPAFPERAATRGVRAVTDDHPAFDPIDSIRARICLGIAIAGIARRAEAITGKATSGMKHRKPKDLAKKLDKSLRVRYSEVVKLRELVKKAQSQARENGKSSDRRR
jgi:hypothetical protein